MIEICNKNKIKLVMIALDLTYVLFIDN